jgi:hypothetical protein
VGFIEGVDRGQAAPLPPCIDDYIAPEALVRVVDAFVADLDLADLGFDHAISATTGRLGYHPADIGAQTVALDGTKMRAVASPKIIAGAERLARDLAHTEREISYYLERLDTIDEHVEQGFSDKPVHREAFRGAVAALQRRRARLAKRQLELEKA